MVNRFTSLSRKAALRPARRGFPGACSASRASTTRPRVADLAEMPVIMRLWETSRILPPGLADNARDPRQRARPVLDRHVQGEDAALARQLAQDHVGQQPHVDIAARHHDADLAAREQRAVVQHGGKARRRRAFDHVFSISRIMARACSICASPHHAECPSPAPCTMAVVSAPGCLTAMPSAMVWHGRRVRRRIAFQRVAHRRIKLASARHRFRCPA